MAAASAAAFAKATASWPEAVEVIAGDEGGADVAVDGSVTTAAAADVAPPIGGAGTTAVASAAGELEAMKIEEEIELGRDGIWRRLWKLGQRME